MRSSIWAAGLAAAALFWAGLVVFGLLDPAYSQARHVVSELGAVGAPNALAWNLIGFIAPGLMLAAFGAAFWTLPGWAAKVASVLMIGSGLAFAATGVFPADLDHRDSASTLAHIAASQASFVLWLGALAVSLIVARSKAVPGLGWASLVFAVAVFAAMAAMDQEYVSRAVSQRLIFGVYFGWVAVAAGLALRAQPKATFATPH